MDDEELTLEPSITVAANSICLLADDLCAMREEKSALDERAKELGARIKVKNAWLVDRMLTNEIQNFNHAGSLFYLTTKTFASPLFDQKQALFDALRKHGFGDMVVENVNDQTLASFVKEQRTENEGVPDWIADLVSVYDETTVNVRKAPKRRRK